MRQTTIRKFGRFKELRARGLSVNKALQGAGLSKSTYSRYRNRMDEVLREAEPSQPGGEALKGVEDRLADLEGSLLALSDDVGLSFNRLTAVKELSALKRDRCKDYDAEEGVCRRWCLKVVGNEGARRPVYRFVDGAWRPDVKHYPEYCAACGSFEAGT